MEGLNGIPALYDYQNVYDSKINPGTIHASNTGLSLFFQRYLLQKIFSKFDFNLPKDWDRDYFLYIMFVLGYGAVLATDKYGTVFQHCTLYGYNIYYRPTHVLVTNPLFRKQYQLLINKQASLLKLTPDYRGVYDIVQLYADMMAVTMEAFGVTAINSKFAYVFMAEDKVTAESMKKLYDQVASGQPAAFADKKLFDADGNPKWNLFLNNLKQNYIGLDLLESLTDIENKFNTHIGINNANLQKRERLITDEVNANNQDTKALVTVWLESLQESFNKCNDLFGLNLSVKLRNEGGDPDAKESNAIDTRNVSI